MSASLHRSRRGLTIGEAVISLAISSMLLVAVAAAFRSSASAIDHNDRFFRATSTGRVCVQQVMAEVRKCKALQVSGSRIDMITADDQDRSYRYVPGDNATGRLMLITNDDDTDPDYQLAGNIASLSFGGSGEMVSMNVTVRVDDQEVTVCGSAAQRRALAYNR